MENVDKCVLPGCGCNENITESSNFLFLKKKILKLKSMESKLVNKGNQE